MTTAAEGSITWNVTERGVCPQGAALSREGKAVERTVMDHLLMPRVGLEQVPSPLKVSPHLPKGRTATPTLQQQ